MEPVLLGVIIIRLLVPLTILRWPLRGGIASLLADAVDYIIFDLTIGVPQYYQRLDKGMDIYYLSIEWFVSLRWAGSTRIIISALYLYRAIGIALFEVTNAQVLFLIFPNVFEYVFLFELFRQRFCRRWRVTAKQYAVLVLVIAVVKIIHEYIIHMTPLLLFPWWRLII